MVIKIREKHYHYYDDLEQNSTFKSNVCNCTIAIGTTEIITITLLAAIIQNNYFELNWWLFIIFKLVYVWNIRQKQYFVLHVTASALERGTQFDYNFQLTSSELPMIESKMTEIMTSNKRHFKHSHFGCCKLYILFHKYKFMF